MNTAYPDTTGWSELRYEVQGVDFVSKFDPSGNIYLSAMFVPENEFIQMNKDCVLELIGNVGSMSREEIVNGLTFMNLGASQSVIELV